MGSWLVAIGLFGWAGLTGCIPDKFIPDLPTDTDTTDTDTDTVPITYVNDDDGSVIVIQWLPHVDDPNPVTVARGIFVENKRGVLNLAQCVGLRDLWCAYDWPENYGDVVRVEPYEDGLLELLSGTYVGDPLQFGPWSLNYTEDASFGLPVYVRFYDAVTPAEGTIEMTLGGEWAEWTGPVFEAPTPFELTSHDPLVRHEFLSTEPLQLTWTPGDNGDIFLYVEAPNGQYLQRLEDTGATSLDLNLFQIEEGDDVSLYIGRWAEASIDLDGNVVNAQVQINQWLHGTYRAFGTRESLEGRMFDDCSTAAGAPPLPQGVYFGDLSGYADDFTPPDAQCTGFPAEGADAVIPLRLQSNEFLEVEYEPLANLDDGSVYLMTAELCDGGLGECLVGADAKVTGQETLQYRNETGFAEDLYLVLDSHQLQVRDSFYLNIGVEPSLSDPLVSSCVEAIAQGPIDEGSYYGQMGTFPNLLTCDPDGEGNAGEGAGGDGKAEIYLLPGQTLTATITGSGTPFMYVVYNCSLAASCTGVTGDSVLTYTNESTVAENVYLVVDSLDTTGTMQDYFLDIEIQ
jgi:hypothetical protein